jgi:hypothetical protein
MRDGAIMMAIKKQTKKTKGEFIEALEKLGLTLEKGTLVKSAPNNGGKFELKKTEASILLKTNRGEIDLGKYNMEPWNNNLEDGLKKFIFIVPKNEPA